MPIFQFYHDSKDYYRVKAKDKETALKILQSIDDDADDDKLQSYFDRSEICMDWVYDGQFEDRWEELDRLTKANERAKL